MFHLFNHVKCAAVLPRLSKTPDVASEMLTAHSERGGIVGLLGREIKLEEEFRLRKDRKQDTREMPGAR